jgi:hypothetical protein
VRLVNPIGRWRQARLKRDLAAQIARVEAYLKDREPPPASGGAPVLFFNASTRIHRLSLNAAFSLLASWTLRAAGQDVRYLVCEAGLRPCVLGTDRASPNSLPPCSLCLGLSQVLVPPARRLGLGLDQAKVEQIRRALSGEPLGELMHWEDSGLPLGAMTLPSVRWVLRRHRLSDTVAVRAIYANYLASAASLAETVKAQLSTWKPRALVVFNGVFYPEAVARRVAEGMGIPVVTHEVGFQPMSAFFSHQEATFREVEVPDGPGLTPRQQGRLETELARRFKGEFTMAGIRFWPKMQGLPAELLERRQSHRQLVSVFTNVVFDTSQVYANVLFGDMFEWLDGLAQIIRRESETLFVLRAHPDETRRGKESQESVTAWLRGSSLVASPNLVFVGPDDAVSSYDIIRESKFVLIYNSSIGLEASILGVPALCAGKARFSQAEAAYLPLSRSDYWRTLEEFLRAERLEVPEAQGRQARAFLYNELFRASLDLAEFLVPDPGLAGMVRFSPFPPSRLSESHVLDQIRKGILGAEPFLAPEG